MQHITLLEDLAIILCTAGIANILFQKIRQPPVLGYLLAGLVVGPFTPPFSLVDDIDEIRALARLGVVFLMFSLGLGFSCRKLGSVGFSALIIGVFEVSMMLTLGFSLGQLLGWASYDSLLLGAALSISSTTIIIKVLEELRLKNQFFAQLMIAVLLVEDALAILLMAFIATTVDGTAVVFSHTLLIATMKLLGAVISWFLIGYFFVPFLLNKTKESLNSEALTVISAGLCLFLSSLAVYFNYSAALGGFIMGSILAETSVVKRIETLMLPIKDLFAAVFFVSVGMLINPALIIEHFPQVILLSILTIFGKVITSSLGVLLSGQSLSNALRVGCGMAQIGEFSFIIIGFGGTIATVNETLYPTIVAVAAITTFTTPYLIRYSSIISDFAQSQMPKFLEKKFIHYQKWTQRLPLRCRWKALRATEILRFFINGLFVALFSDFIFKTIAPMVLPSCIFPGWCLPLIVLATWIILSPLIWVMLFGLKKKTPKRVARVLTLLFLFYLSSNLLDHSFQYLVVGALLSLFFVISFHLLKFVYMWLETNLTHNLSRPEEDCFKEYKLIRLKVTEKFPGIGLSLEQSSLVVHFGLNVIALKRANSVLFLPKEDERVLLDDEIVLIGDYKEIKQYRDFVMRVETL
ncbi:Uncharacterized protein PHSC3_000469 [Chlamydiales bacterium STE3]|nr:Uncharacterized protein PHSC3_000469 [Chlamydiales bacterium STE3]